MKDILIFLDEMKRSDWLKDVSYQQRRYNGITVQESEQLYRNKISFMYTAAVMSLIKVPTEKYGLLQSLIEEVNDCQDNFEMPSDELLKSLMRDYNQSNHQIRTLKEDYDYLCFVRDCMNIQKNYLRYFRDKLLPQKSDMVEISEKDIHKADSKHEPIKGVKGLAEYLDIGTTKAQEIINSNVLQANGVAYRVGRGWNFNPQKLDELLSNSPSLLYERNK